YEGAYRRNWSDKRFRRMFRLLDRYTVIESSPEICRCWGEIRALRKRQSIAPDDAWIAATALACDCPLVTHNPTDFKGIAGLQIITAAET
ncbi:MAG TPA: PIN domain-containing protein, partial [Gemmataceae bacterium]|nr:PIN domain-containing protein [Gemmataceae bacterium]